MDAKIDVTIKSDRGSTRGTVLVRRLNQEQRSKRAIKALGIGYGLCVASIFIPIFHFVLVPGLFIAAPIFSYFLYRQKDMVIGGEGTCPRCARPLPIVSGAEIWPLEDVCGLCHEHVTVEKCQTTEVP